MSHAKSWTTTVVFVAVMAGAITYMLYNRTLFRDKYPEEFETMLELEHDERTKSLLLSIAIALLLGYATFQLTSS